MGLLNMLNHLATFLLLVSFILLLVTSVSSSAVNYLALLNVNLNNGHKVSLGSWGACLRQSGKDACTKSHVGYDAGAYLNNLVGSDFGSGSRRTIRVLTRAMVLHPIACILTFLAFLSSAARGVGHAVLAVLLALLAFVITVIVMACDFGWASLIHHRINHNNFNGSKAHYRECIWFVLVSALLTLLASFLLLVSWCSSRNRHDGQTTTTTRRRRI